MNGSRKNNSNVVVYLGLGSNIEPSKNIVKAVDALKSKFRIINISNFWESTSEGENGSVYLNGTVAINTRATYKELKILLREIEKTMGRVRTLDKNAPRTIDIDILIYDGNIMDANIWTKSYLAIPLAEIIPSFVNPMTGETIKHCSDTIISKSSIPLRRKLLDLSWIET